MIPIDRIVLLWGIHALAATNEWTIWFAVVGTGIVILTELID